MTLPYDDEAHPKISAREFLRALILIPRLWAIFFIVSAVWIFSVTHLLMCLLFNLRQGCSGLLSSTVGSGNLRVHFIHDWLKLRPEGTYPGWLVRWHAWHRALVLLGFRATLWALGYLRIFIRGAPRPETTVFICNHRGIIDALVLSFALDDIPVFVSGPEILDLPFIREVAISIDVFILDESLRSVAVPMLRKAIKSRYETRKLVLFPRGEPSFGVEIALWHHPRSFDVAESPLHMQAVALTFQGTGAFSPSWIDGGLVELFLIVFDLARIRTNRARVTFLPPVVPDAVVSFLPRVVAAGPAAAGPAADPRAVRDALIAAYRRDIARALEVPLVLEDGTRIMVHDVPRPAAASEKA